MRRMRLCANYANALAKGGKKNKMFRGVWNVTCTSSRGGNVTLIRAVQWELLLDWEAPRTSAAQKKRRSHLACPKTRVNRVRSRTHSHTRETPGMRQLRLRHARNLLPRSASLLRIKPYSFDFWQGLQLLDVFLRTGFICSAHEFLHKFHENWVMITSPTVSVLRNSTNPAWESGSSGEKGAEKISHRSVHNSVSPADPSRQASRLPIKVLKMLTARAGHLLHPEYLQPLPSTPVSPIEVSTKMPFWRQFAHNRHRFLPYQSGLLHKQASIIGEDEGSGQIWVIK